MEESIIAIILTPLMLFMIFVAPIWLILHYRSKKLVSQGLSDEDYEQLRRLAAQAEKMAERIHTLEALLDEETPQWRQGS